MRNAGLVVVTIVALVVIFGFFGWAFYATRSFGSWTGGSTAIAIMLVGGVFGAGGLTGVLMWLAFVSERKGYDDPPHIEEPPP